MPGIDTIKVSPLRGTLLLALVVCGLSSGPLAAADAPSRYEFTERHLGVDVHLTLYADREAVANAAAAAAYHRIAALNLVLTDYDENSEAMRLVKHAVPGQPVPVSQELWDALQASQIYSVKSNGVFDVTVGPLVKLWRRARRKGELPDPQLVVEARQRVDYRFIQFSPEKREVTLARTGLQLDFGGIGKGFIADRALQTLKEQGCPSSLVAIAGDIAAGDAPPAAAGWKIGIAPLESPTGPPSRYLLLNNCGVSTSGDAFQFVEIAGVRYSHIVDPRTGLGLTERCSVTIVAPDCTTADGLATTVCLLGRKAGFELLEETPGVAGLYVAAGENGPTAEESTRLKMWLIPSAP